MRFVPATLCISVYLFIFLSVYLCLPLSVCLYVYLSTWVICISLWPCNPGCRVFGEEKFMFVCDSLMFCRCSMQCPHGLYGSGCTKKCDCPLNGCHPTTGVCRPCEDPNHGNGTICVQCTCNTAENEKCINTQFECG